MLIRRNRTVRPGIILLVVVSMLSLFAVVGITFVLYAESAANTARISREAQFGGHTGVAPGLNIVGRGAGEDAPPIPNEIFNNALGNLIYDVEDDAGRYNALRGWSLARDMYGYDSNDNVVPAAAGSVAPLTHNTKPFSGLGIPEGALLSATNTGITDFPTVPFADSIDESNRPRYFTNYTLSSKQSDWAPANALYPKRDPEWYQNTNVPAGPGGQPQLVYATKGAAGAFHIPKNVPYTAADMNHLFLAAIQAGKDTTTAGVTTTNASGEVLVPSFYRPWQFEAKQKTTIWTGIGPATSSGTTTIKPVFASDNPNWTTAAGRHRILRPTPYDHPNFPIMPTNADGTITGDVTNLEGKAIPRHDSIWMDIDLPVRQWRGKKYKPLVALLVTDLDGRINANLASGMMTTVPAKVAGGPSTYTHKSNQMWGPWEMDLTLALGEAAATNANLGVDTYNLIHGGFSPTAPKTNPSTNKLVTTRVGSRYGSSDTPYGFDGTKMPAQYTYANLQPTTAIARADYDANPLVAADRLSFPGANSHRSTPHWQADYSSPLINDFTSTQSELALAIKHPSLHNPYLSMSITPTQWNQNRVQHASEMRYLNQQFRGNSVDVAKSDMAAMMTNTLGSTADTGAMARFRVTTISNDLQSPGLQGYMWNSIYNQTDTISGKPHTFDNRYFVGGSQANATTPQPILPLGLGNVLEFIMDGQNPANAAAGTINRNSFPHRANRFPPTTATTALIDRECDFADDYRPLQINTRQGALQPTGTASVPPPTLLSPIDLNRPLPNLTLAGISAADFQEGIKARQILARDIFLRLAQATGAWPNPPEPSASTYGTKAQYLKTLTGTAHGIPNFGTTSPPGAASRAVQNTLRYLAQLSVNVVDYIDNDDIITPFNWRNLNPEDPGYLTPDPGAGGKPPTIDDPTRTTEVLFGVENPKLVINEAYSHFRNDQSDPLHKLIAGVDTPIATMQSRVESWVELKNPIYAWPKHASDSFDPKTTFQAKLADYRVLLIKVPAKAGATDAMTNTWLKALKDSNPEAFSQLVPLDVTGKPTTATTQVVLNLDKAKSVYPYNATTVVAKDDSFYLLAPNSPTPPPADTSVAEAKMPSITTSYEQKFDELYYQQPITQNSPEYQHLFVLQRLANGDYSPTYDAKTNPWVTVDYFAQTNVNQIHDNRVRDDNPGTMLKPDITTQSSLGRRQPVDGNDDNNAVPVALAPPPAPATSWVSVVPQTTKHNGNIKHTFGLNNVPNTLQQGNYAANTYEWLTHLDRQLISPVELFTVCAFPPHRLTHQFHYYPDPAVMPAVSTTGRYMHLADWNTTKPVHTLPPPATSPITDALPAADHSRLFRALALLETKPRMLGMPLGGRIPGKVNINTIYDKEVFEAVCAAGLANNFTQADVDKLYQNVIAKHRNPGDGKILPTASATTSPNIPVGTPSRFDKPYLPAGIPIYQAHPAGSGTNFFFKDGIGIQDTIFADNALTLSQATIVNPVPPPAPLTVVQKQEIDQHPFTNAELLKKVYNNITTRSNTFQVWCTIGYFEVANDGPYTPANRPQLGKELGTSDGTTVRHKFYTVVDRTNLAIAGNANPTSTTQGPAPIIMEFMPVWQPNQMASVTSTNTKTVGTAPNSKTYYEYEIILPTYVKPDSFTGTDLLTVSNDMYTGTPFNCIKKISGEYDGKDWTLLHEISGTQAGSSIIVGMGLANEEQITLKLDGNSVIGGFIHGTDPTSGATPPAGTTGSASTHIAPFRITLRTLNKHAPGESIVINPGSFFGNPGPQPYFNYQAAPYTDVVKYAVQVK